MLISEAITYCEYMTGQVVASEQLVRWLSELDGRLAFEFYRTGEWAPYDPTDDTGAELLVPFPWDGLYVHHLAAKTYFSNGEYDRYENERVMSEQTLADFRSFMQRTQAALCGCGFPTDKTGGTYVTVIPEQASSLWFWIDAYSLAVKHGFTGTEDEWLASLVGPKGDDGERGEDGSSFTIKGLYATYDDLISAHPTGSEGDAYAVGTASNNTTYNWDVDAEAWVDIGPFRGPQGDEGPAGQDGAPGQDGQDGAPGQDGVSPEVTISTITGGHAVKITDADHPAGQTFNVMDGADGQDGTNGQDGSDGVSPGVSISSITGGHSVTITDADHPGGQTFNVMDGVNGQDGTDGNDGVDGVSPAVSVSSITGGHTVTITDKDHPNGQSFNVMDGTDGTDGQDGAPGPNSVSTSTGTNITGLFKGDGSTVSAATAGTDYQAPLTAGTDYATPAAVAAAEQISAPTLVSPATENIAAWQYRVYNDLLYKTTAAITSGETASSFSSKLSAVSDGGLNDLKSALSAVPYTFVNLDDCTSLSEIYSLLKVAVNIYGIGTIGSLQNTNLKTLIGNPGVGNYAAVQIRLVLDGYSAFSHACAVMEAIATGDSNSAYNVARKYLWLNGSTRIESQSAWTSIVPT